MGWINTKETTLRKKIFLGVLAAMLAGMLLSACFIAAEADHDCSGEDCPVCVFLTLCEQNIRLLKNVLIRDATACCAQGIEFVLTDDYKVPEDYPKSGEEITVTGFFDSYMEDKFTFYHLKDAILND